MATTLHYILIGSGDTSPTAAQIVAGVSYTGATVHAAGDAPYTSAGTYDFDSDPATGLTPGTTYTLWAVAYDGSNYGTPVSGSVTTGSVFDIAGSATAGLSGALSVTGDIQITLAPELDISGDKTAALSGAVTLSGDVQFTVPTDISQSAAASLASTLTIAGDLEYSTAIFLDLSAQPIALSGTFSAAGDFDPYPFLDLTASTAALAGSLAVTGDLQAVVPFDLSEAAATPLNGTLEVSGDLQYSTTPPPPPAPSGGWGGGAVGGGGGRGLRELTSKIGKDAEELLERKRKARHDPVSEGPKPQPRAAQIVEASSVTRAESRTDHDESRKAEPAVSGAQAAILSDLRMLIAQVKNLETLILEDRASTAKRREQEEEEAAVIKLLTS